MLNDIQKSILKTVSDMTGIPDGAVNIRLDGQKAFRQNSEHIQIVSKTDKDGIDIRIAPFTKSENVHIPVVLSRAGFHDMVYNDFFVGEGADVTIVAGCGIHNCGDCDSEHDGIHTFYIGKNAKVHYIEKHYGEGEGTGEKILNPVTEVTMEEGSYCEMEMIQLAGVDSTLRETDASLDARAKIVITERLLTHGRQRFERADSLPLGRQGQLRAGVLPESRRQHRLPCPCSVRLDNYGQGKDPLYPRDNGERCRRADSPRGRHRTHKQRPIIEAYDLRTDRGGGRGGHSQRFS